MLEDFADSVCHAHSRCKNLTKNVKDGRFLTETVRKVTMIWKRTNSSSTSSSTFSSGASHASQDVENEFDNKADDDQCLQEAESALANAMAMFQTSSSSSKSLKRTMSTVSIASSCCSEADAPAGAKKQPVKVV